MTPSAASRLIRYGPGLLALAALGSVPAQERSSAAAASADAPREIGLEERSQSRLAQLDLTVIGPPDLVGALTAEDFSIRIHLRKVKEFQLDRLCESPASVARDERPQEDGPSAPRRAAATYLFYFDQPHLTMVGRQRAIDLSRRLVERLVSDGNRAMIVSNAARTRILQPLTDDVELLHSALEQLEPDRRQWDTFAEFEDRRVAEVVHSLNVVNNTDAAINLARQYQKEERWRMERAMRRLAVTLGQLVDLDAPKALIYFADTTRSNPGEHYLTFFGRAMRESLPPLAIMSTDSAMGGLSFDRVINQAAAQGIRIYTVEARGLALSADLETPSPTVLRTVLTVPSSARTRLNDTHRSLGSLAAETGGQAFLNGVSAVKIADRIVADSSCVYLASFDPAGWAEDVPLRVVVNVRRDDVELRVRGRIVLQSESARLTSSLLRAFDSPDSIADPFDVRAGIVPTGFDDGKYFGLLQVSVPGSPLHGATWDLGASIVVDDRVRDEGSGRVSVSGPGLPVVFEREVQLKPGAFEIVSVAHEGRSGLVASERSGFDWPPLRRGEAAVGPFAVLQPMSGAFMREGELRDGGSLLLAEGDAVQPAKPAALVGLVCAGRTRGAELEVERRLVGPTSHEFPSLTLGSEDGCVQVRDVIPSNTLGAGLYRYVVALRAAGEDLARGGREFLALADE